MIAEYSATLPNNRSTTAQPSLNKAQPARAARHIWGHDISGKPQGAGGIGGLLASTHFQPSSTTVNNSKPSQTFCLSYDSNGNVVLLTDPTGQESARYAYDAFGKTLLATGSVAHQNRYRFSTKPVEIASSLCFYGFRYYSPELGRWLSQDPIAEHGGVNLYVIGHNQVVNMLDVMGKFSIWTTTCYPGQVTQCDRVCTATGAESGTCLEHWKKWIELDCYAATMKNMIYTHLEVDRKCHCSSSLGEYTINLDSPYWEQFSDD